MDQLTEDALGAEDLIMLIKVGQSALKATDADELYELARKWWKASPVQARRARRVLAVADNTVIAAYEPERWEVSTHPDTAGRIAFHGHEAPESSSLVGLSVAHLYPKGASNPVRYTTVATLSPVETSGPGGADNAGDLEGGNDSLLLLRINQSWHPEISPEDLFEATRGCWVMSPTKAEHVGRVLAVAHGVVREVYEPVAWSPSPVAGEENRIGFDGFVAEDRDRWVGLDVSAVFPHGSQNPVRYVSDEDLGAGHGASLEPAVPTEVRGSEPSLAEQVNPLLEAFDLDLLWSMSRAAQELFHSNTLSWLMWQHPVAAVPVAGAVRGPRADAEARGVAGVEAHRPGRSSDRRPGPLRRREQALLDPLPRAARAVRVGGSALVEGSRGARSRGHVVLPADADGPDLRAAAPVAARQVRPGAAGPGDVRRGALRIGLGAVRALPHAGATAGRAEGRRRPAERSRRTLLGDVRSRRAAPQELRRPAPADALHRVSPRRWSRSSARSSRWRSTSAGRWG